MLLLTGDGLGAASSFLDSSFFIWESAAAEGAAGGK